MISQVNNVFNRTFNYNIKEQVRFGKRSNYQYAQPADTFVRSKKSTNTTNASKALPNQNLMQETAKSFFGINSKDNRANMLADELKDPKKALLFFKEAKSQIEQFTDKQDPVINYYKKQLELSIEQLEAGETNRKSAIAFGANKKGNEQARNIFASLKIGCNRNFSDYFPVNKFGMDEYDFNTKLYNIFMDEKKKFIIVESLNAELSKRGMSDELNIYIKENKSNQMGKLASGSLGSTGIGPLMVAARSLYNANNKKMDDFDRSVENIRLSYDLTDLLVAGGAIGAVATFNAEVASANAMNPEIFSKTAIWIGNGLIALGCIGARVILKEARERDEREIIEALKYVKAIHICMQEGYLDPNKVGKLVQQFSN